MSCTLYERIASRDFSESRTDASFTGEFIAVGSTDQTEVRAATLSQTPLSFFNLYRSDIKCTPRGGPYWDVTVTYKNIPAEEAVGQQEAGQEQQQPATPASNDAPLGPGYSFSTSGGTTHITQSFETMSTTTAAGYTASDYKRAIGVSRDGVEGCDIVTANQEFTREVRRANVSLNYYKTLVSLTGNVNTNTFYGLQPGEALYLGCEGKYASGEGWTLTHKWSGNRNRQNIVISDLITVASKKGWHYLWVEYEKVFVTARPVQIPIVARVERVYPEDSFGGLEIGS